MIALCYKSYQNMLCHTILLVKQNYIKINHLVCLKCAQAADFSIYRNLKRTINQS
jgi:hypothetical protein